jgi:hypothetical protein
MHQSSGIDQEDKPWNQMMDHIERGSRDRSPGDRLAALGRFCRQRALVMAASMFRVSVA